MRNFGYISGKRGVYRFLDNIFIERLWRTLKYECVYLHAWETGSETKAAIRKWMTFYNHQRPHSALGGKPPALVYWQSNDINQPDQQVQRVAQITPDSVQEMGSGSTLLADPSGRAGSDFGT